MHVIYMCAYYILEIEYHWPVYITMKIVAKDQAITEDGEKRYAMRFPKYKQGGHSTVDCVYNDTWYNDRQDVNTWH